MISYVSAVLCFFESITVVWCLKICCFYTHDDNMKDDGEYDAYDDNQIMMMEIVNELIN